MPVMAVQEPDVTKIVLLGKKGVGKTTLIRTFLSERRESLANKYVHNFSLLDEQHRMEIWDTLDDPSLPNLFPILFLKAHVIILMFDTGKPQTLSYLHQYVQEINKRKETYKLVVLGNNLTQPTKVTYSAGKMFADHAGAQYMSLALSKDLNYKSAIGFQILEHLVKNLYNISRLDEARHTVWATYSSVRDWVATRLPN